MNSFSSFFLKVISFIFITSSALANISYDPYLPKNNSFFSLTYQNQVARDSMIKDVHEWLSNVDIKITIQRVWLAPNSYTFSAAPPLSSRYLVFSLVQVGQVPNDLIFGSKMMSQYNNKMDLTGTLLKTINLENLSSDTKTLPEPQETQLNSRAINEVMINLDPKTHYQFCVTQKINNFGRDKKLKQSGNLSCLNTLDLYNMSKSTVLLYDNYGEVVVHFSVQEN